MENNLYTLEINLKQLAIGIRLKQGYNSVIATQLNQNLEFIFTADLWVEQSKLQVIDCNYILLYNGVEATVKPNFNATKFINVHLKPKVKWKH